MVEMDDLFNVYCFNHGYNIVVILQFIHCVFETKVHFMALPTVSTESARTEAGNSVLTASIFHELAANLGFCACVLHQASAEIRCLHVSGES